MSSSHRLFTRVLNIIFEFHYVMTWWSVHLDVKHLLLFSVFFFVILFSTSLCFISEKFLLLLIVKKTLDFSLHNLSLGWQLHSTLSNHRFPIGFLSRSIDFICWSSLMDVYVQCFFFLINSETHAKHMKQFKWVVRVA